VEGRVALGNLEGGRKKEGEGGGDGGSGRVERRETGRAVHRWVGIGRESGGEQEERGFVAWEERGGWGGVGKGVEKV